MGKTSRKTKVNVELGSDQTSLHNPWKRWILSCRNEFSESNNMMVNNPEQFKKEVQKTLIRHTKAINTLSERGMYFFDYGNAFY